MTGNSHLVQEQRMMFINQRPDRLVGLYSRKISKQTISNGQGGINGVDPVDQAFEPNRVL